MLSFIGIFPCLCSVLYAIPLPHHISGPPDWFSSPITPETPVSSSLLHLFLGFSTVLPFLSEMTNMNPQITSQHTLIRPAASALLLRLGTNKQCFAALSDG